MVLTEMEIDWHNQKILVPLPQGGFCTNGLILIKFGTNGPC